MRRTHRSHQNDQRNVKRTTKGLTGAEGRTVNECIPLTVPGARFMARGMMRVSCPCFVIYCIGNATRASGYIFFVQQVLSFRASLFWETHRIELLVTLLEMKTAVSCYKTVALVVQPHYSPLVLPWALGLLPMEYIQLPWLYLPDLPPKGTPMAVYE